MVNAPLRVLFFGTPQFAVPTLEHLLQSHHPVVGVVTQPDRPRGRGQRPSASPVKALALAAGLPVLQPASLKDPAFLSDLANLRADLGVVAAYGRILTDIVLGIPRLGMINVHASLLPRYRGAAPVHRAVIAGERETGVTIMRVVKALDAGPMLAVVRRPIDEEDTSEDVESNLARMGAALLVSTVDRMAQGDVPGESQDERAVTYAARLTKDDGRIDWGRSAVEIHNLIRGLHPWPHAFTFLHERRLILLRSRAVDQTTGAQPGLLMTAHGDDLRVATGGGTLLIEELQAEGKRPMAPREFLAGHRMNPGDRFTPQP